jgi:hypothetical protein
MTTLDLSAAPKRIQELMDEGRNLQDAIEEATLVGISIKIWWQADITEIGWSNSLKAEHFADDRLILEFYHEESKTRWLAKFSGYDSEEVEVFGIVNSWSG